VLRFVTAEGDPDATLAFIDFHGFPGEMEGHVGIAAHAMALQTIDNMQCALSMVLHLHQKRDHAGAAAEFNELATFNPFGFIRGGPPYGVSSAAMLPILKAAGEDARPALTLQPRSLFGFMIAELALILSGGVEVNTCDHCRKPFTVGASGAKRRGSVYCSPRCSVAAFRERQKAPRKKVRSAQRS
jgi:hypothetical protein